MPLRPESVRVLVPPLLSPPAPLITPEKLDARLFVLPTVSANPEAMLTIPLFKVVPTLVNEPMVCEAPVMLRVAPSATSTAASEPSAVAVLEFKVPAVILMAVPSTKLVALAPKLRVPMPCLVIVRATLPSPTAPKVMLALVVSKVGLPVSVVAPKTSVGFAV